VSLGMRRCAASRGTFGPRSMSLTATRSPVVTSSMSLHTPNAPLPTSRICSGRVQTFQKAAVCEPEASQYESRRGRGEGVLEQRLGS